MPLVLSPEDIENINNALELAKELKAEVARAQQAGIPTSMTVEDVENQIRQLMAIKRVYITQPKRGASE